MKKNNYHKQDGCHNCKHVFKYTDWEEGPTYYCALGSNDRPLCGSSLMKESWFTNTNDEEASCKAMVLWHRWSEKREVCTSGICDCFLKKGKKDGK